MLRCSHVLSSFLLSCWCVIETLCGMFRKKQGYILPPRLSLGLVLLAAMSKRPLAQAQGLLQGIWRPKTFTFLAAAKTLTTQYSQRQDCRRFSHSQVATKIRAGGKHLLAGDPAAQVLKTFFFAFLGNNFAYSGKSPECHWCCTRPTSLPIRV